MKAPVHSTPEILRNAQMIKARVIWSTTPMAVIPVLAVTRQGGQSFVFVARQQNGSFVAHQTPVTLGDTVGNNYSITSGLNAGDQVIVSGIQYLVNDMPVILVGGLRYGLRRSLLRMTIYKEGSHPCLSIFSSIGLFLPRCAHC